MSVQSSTAVICRALVMLSCLVAIPLIAVFGRSFRGTVDALLSGCWGTESQSSGELLTEAPRFQPANQASLSTADSAGGGCWQDVPAAVADAEGCAAGSPSSPTATAQQLPLQGQPDSVPASYETYVGPPTDQPGPETSSPAVASSQAAASDPQPAGLVPVDRTDQFTYIQRRLRQLGATYYLLEAWGSEGQYRFYCKIAIGGNPNFNRYFEATDVDPIMAMMKVLAEVEAWRTAR